jgi:SAM-dependent methyltransferase
MTEWWSGFFSGDWASIQPQAWTADETVEAADLIEKALQLPETSSILDVPCGNGRISLELARRGYEVTGIDFSTEMIGLGRQAAEEQGLQVDWQEGDMRMLPSTGTFDAAICWWGSFGYFDDEGNAEFLEAVFGALRPGGKLLIDSPGLEVVLSGWQPRDWSRVGDFVVLEERRFDAASSRVEGRWTFLRNGEESVRESSVRLYSLRELTEVCREAGFTDVGVVDDQTGEVVQAMPGRLFLATG